MLEKIEAVRFIKQMGVGRTKPALIECELDDGQLVEVVVKFTNGTFEKEKNLYIEALVAMLAADLNLPVPEPYIVSISEEFIESIENLEIKEHIKKSNRIAFGSRLLPSVYSNWLVGQIVPESLVQRAAEIFVFDVIVVNSDRNSRNTNCLYSGDEFAIFDHELTLNQKQVLFWKNPWDEDGFESYVKHDSHIFLKPSFSKSPDNLDNVIAYWGELTEERVRQYFEALPEEWSIEKQDEEEFFDYIINVKKNIRSIVSNALGVLK